MKAFASYVLALILALSMTGCLKEEPLDANSTFSDTVTQVLQEETMSVLSFVVDGTSFGLDDLEKGASNVLLQPLLRVNLSKPILASTVDTSTAYVEDAQGNSVSITVNKGSSSIEISPNVTLTPSTKYYLVLKTTIQSNDGLALYKEYKIPFTTVDEAVLSTSSITATHVTQGRNAVDTNFTVTFSDAIRIDDNTSIRLINTQTQQTRNIAAIAQGNTLVIDPSGDLNTSTTYTVRILAGAVSKATTGLPLYTLAEQNFTISPHARPVVTPITTDIVEPTHTFLVDFGTALASGSTNGVSVTNGAAFSKTLGTTSAIRVIPSATWNEGNFNITFDTNVTNIDGVAMSTPYTKSLVVNASPRVTSTDFNGSTDIRIDRNITLLFSESIDKESTIIGVTLKNSANASVTASHYWDETNRTLIIDPSADLNPSSNYSVTLANTITDASQRPLITSYTLSFATNANTRPSILSTAPAHNATGVGIDANYTVTFSEEVNRSIVEAGGVTIDGVSVTYAWSGDGKSVTLSPLGYLNTDANYTVVVSPTVVDLTGFAVAQEYRYAFRTGVNARPTVASTTIGSAHYIDANFTITFSEAMSPTNVITLSGASIPHVWNGTNTQVTLKPSSYLSPSTTYVLRVPTSLTDTTGLALAQEYNYTFTTHSNRAPAISSRSFSRPAAATTTQAAIDSNISVLFDTNVSIADSSKIVCKNGASTVSVTKSEDAGRVKIVPASDWNVSTNYLCTFGAGAVKETVSGILTTQESNVTFTTSQYGRPAKQHSVFYYDVNDSMTVDFGVTLHSSSTSNVSITTIANRTDGFTVSIVDAQKLRVAPTYPWATGTLYLNLGQAIANLDGVPMASADQLGLTIGERPRVVATSPEANAKGVNYGSGTISYTFAKSVSIGGCLEVLDTNGSNILTTSPTPTNTSGTSIYTYAINNTVAGQTYTAKLRANCVFDGATGQLALDEYNFSFSTFKVLDVTTLLTPITGNFGQAVAVSGNGKHVYVSAPTDYMGRLYKFSYNTSWESNGSIPSGTAALSYTFSNVITTTYDGNRTIMGDSSHQVANPYDGRAIVYSGDFSTALQKAGDGANDYFGKAVGITNAGYSMVKSETKLSIFDSTMAYVTSQTKNTDYLAALDIIASAGEANVFAGFAVEISTANYALYTYDVNSSVRTVHNVSNSSYKALDISSDAKIAVTAIVSGTTETKISIYRRSALDVKFQNAEHNITLTGYDDAQIALSGDGKTLVVGLPLDPDGGTTDKGEARIYRYINSAWTYITTLYELTRVDQSLFGNRVDVNYDGSVIVVGDAPSRNKAYIFYP
ncbi:MAG: hypothetical protein KU37_05835 [Sulfuricurvum sp. PC08-66]|nr:MAG: hypothetical protein KU37_05835 [Sulfuricurvum sp. PC08-66]